MGAALIVLAASCFATLGPLTRFAEDAGVSALALVAWRGALGATVMLAFIVTRRLAGLAAPLRIGSIPARDRWFMLGAVAASTVLNLSVFVAFTRISIALALLLFYLYPAMVAVVSVVWLGERLDRLRWLALGLSLVGLVLVLAGAGDLGTLDLLGIALAFVGGLAQVFYVLAARYGFAHVPGPFAAAFTMGGAAGLYVAFLLVIGGLSQLSAPLESAVAFWPVAVAGVLGAGVPTVSYITGIRMLGPSRASILATLEPVVGVGLAAWLLAETPTPTQIGGGALILVAAIVLQLGPRATRVPPADHEAVA